MTEETLIDARAQAVAEVQQMHRDLDAARETIGQLRADLHREQDRVVLLTDERTRWRKEANIYRNKLVELATATSNIGLLTTAAQEIMHNVNELLANVDGFDPEEKKVSPEALAASLAAVDAAIAEPAGSTPVAPLSEGS